MSRFRDPDKRKNLARVGENREAWLMLNSGVQIVLYVYPEGADDGVQDKLVLMFQRPGYRPYSLNLTGMTGEEVEALQKFLDEALSRAKPISDDLDRIAKEAWDAGDDSYARAYRRSPVTHVRERSVRQHDPGVPLGPDGAVGVRTGAAPD